MDDEHETRTDPPSQILDPALVAKKSPPVPLNHATLDVSSSLSVFVPHRIQPNHLGSAFHPNGVQLSWPQNQLARYLKGAFFFNPFRHNRVFLQKAKASEQLSQNGDNLPQVLHTIQSNKPLIFQKIRVFLDSAVPNLGQLQTPIVGEDTEVRFLHPRWDHPDGIKLHEMGAGIAQLLMIATVLCTTDDRSTLFIEEPENHLHAGAQRFLIEKLHGTSRQVFLTTHSPTFVNINQRKSIYQLT